MLIIEGTRPWPVLNSQFLGSLSYFVRKQGSCLKLVDSSVELFRVPR
jgi:hypothetical protein